MTLIPVLLMFGGLTLPSDVQQVTDIDGLSHDLHGRPTVYVFVKTTCPIANYFHPTLRRLSDEWGDDVSVVMVHTEQGRTLSELRSHRDEYDVAGIVVHDVDQKLTVSMGATITPEAVVVDKTGAIRYRGRIDDTYLGFGRRRQVVSSHDLKNAVEAVRAGQAVILPSTPAIGCKIRLR